MNSEPPPTARLKTPPMPPPPPYCVEVVIWMLDVIQESSPDSAKIASPGLSVSSRTGIVVPMIFSSTMGLLRGRRNGGIVSEAGAAPLEQPRTAAS